MEPESQAVFLAGLELLATFLPLLHLGWDYGCEPACLTAIEDWVEVLFLPLGQGLGRLEWQTLGQPTVLGTKPN